ncbi:hypothetical protein [Clostridium senegalense]|uniref:Terpene cyclase/mutase family protein n=1 Tax=Clostridium senegalense TaxID=1465809 RepID=A0A6M0H075_9CLOT|nr:hypothetical protein [Clostridium senegalense]NEU04155.1 hypothetical protein [Clostridium senegalense]
MNKNFKRGLAAFIIANSVLTTANIGVLNNNVFATERYAVESREIIEKDYNSIIDECVNGGLHHLINKDSGVWYSKDFSDWEALTVSSFNKEIPSSYVENLAKKIETKDSSLFGKDGKFKGVTDCERTIIGLVSAGKDPRNFAGYNLIEDLCERNLGIEQDIFSKMFGLIALDCGNFEIPSGSKFTRYDLVDGIVEKKLKSGGWSWGDTIDVDTTAMAISALAPYYNEDYDAKEAIDDALIALSKIQGKTTGEFTSTWTPNGSSESLAQVIIALCSIGKDPANCNEFIKDNGKNLLDLLLEYKTTDGGFEHDKKNSDQLNGFATEQAFRALSAYKQFKSGKVGSIYFVKDFN